jgi:hypothetical protein
MPAIRDSQWATTTVATGTTLAIPMPTSVLNDLLLAVMMADTSGGTWTSAGWTHVTGSPSLNTCQLVVMWKLATASEAASYTFTGTTAESRNGAIISIKDVNTTNPFGTTPVISFVTQAAAAKFNMQSIITNTNNSLLLYASANSGIGVPSLLEGPVYGLVGADGVAESLGIGWSFKAVAGATSSVVGVSNVATGAGVKLAIQIAPPAAGATVVPSYCSADDSTYLNPLNGATAYNGDTAVAATAGTGFGTSLGGKTADAATVGTALDVGINSYHSCARLTTVTGVQNLSGAELVFAAANRPNVTGKNILIHVGPSTEGQLQRFSSVSSGRGIWFGMRSGAAANYKIWQVYGVELGSTRHQPVVINEAALSTVASNGTLNPAIILALGMWVSGTGNSTTIWDFASLWLLGTVTICGGNAAFPISIEGIVAAAALGKERKSVIKQGFSQALSYQPLQFGDGTNVTNLNLDSTAFEFPSQYNSISKQVTYNSTDNVSGLTYYASASCSMKHTNSVVSSPSDYHWRIHASSSASAIYDFNGLALIGAGDVVLQNVTTFSTMSFVNCTNVTQNSAPISNCIFNYSYLKSNLPSAISGCDFTSAGTGHAIEITVPGTYNFSDNQFAGYSGTSTNAAIYNNSGGAVTLNISNGGATPSVRNGAGASTTLNNATLVDIVLSNIVVGSKYRIEEAATKALLFEGVAATSTITIPYTWSANVNTRIRVRRSSTAPKYQAFEILGTITNLGLSVYISQIPDVISQ